MLIGDSASCPHCGHVIDAIRASSEFLDMIPSGELELSDAEDELPCKQCGEQVRIGLVRCWHCGAFTNSDIEASYQRMQANPPPIMYSDLSHKQAERPAERAPTFAQVADDDGGFELEASYGVPMTGGDRSATTTSQPSTATYGQQPAPSVDEDDFTLAPDAAPVTAYAPAAKTAPPATSQPAAAEPTQQQYDQAAYDQQAYDQQAYDAQQYQIPWGYKLSADGTAYEIDYDAWQQAGYDPNAQPGEPGYYDPYAAQGYDVQQPATDGQIPAAEGTHDGQATSSSTQEMPDVAHSVSTGGESLLAAAMAEEKESVQLRKAGARRRASGQALPPGSFVVFCPNGHRVQVHDRHRGRAGRCPNCKAVFFVPALDPAALAAAEAAAAIVPNDGKYQAGDYNKWMFDLRIHTVSPLKLKLKEGAMAAEYDSADIAFSKDSLLVMNIFKRAGTFAAMQEKKKKPAVRQAVGDYLQTKKPMSGLPVPFQTLVTAAEVGQLKIVQPAIPGEEIGRAHV